jgi:hypothetical protein
LWSWSHSGAEIPRTRGDESCRHPIAEQNACHLPKNSHTTFLANNNREPRTSEKQRSITSRPSTPPLNPSIAVRVIERLLSNMADWESDDAATASGGQLTFASSSSTTSALSELIHHDDHDKPRRVVSVSVVGASEGHHHDESHLLLSLQPLASVGMLERLAGDVLVAATVTGAVSPFLTIVDKAIVQRAAGSHSVLQSARASVAAMLSQPATYFRSPTFLWMWATYASTYSAANCLRTITEQREYEALRHVDSSTAGGRNESSRAQYERQKRSTPATLFVGTTIVNSAASIVKDRAYAQMFGGGGGGGAGAQSVAPAIPRISYLLWMARDLTVIGSSFILPSYVAQHLQDRHGWNSGTATKVAQVATPMAAQLVAGPLHYVGLDCFTRPIHAGGTANSILSSVTNRLRQLQRAAPEVITARMVRILPAYGITGVYNTQWRNAYRNYLIESKVRHMIESENQTLRPVAIAAAGAGTSAAATNRRRATTTNDLVSLIRAKSVRNNNEPQQHQQQHP